MDYRLLGCLVKFSGIRRIPSPYDLIDPSTNRPYEPTLLKQKWDAFSPLQQMRITQELNKTPSSLLHQTIRANMRAAGIPISKIELFEIK